MPFRSSDPNAAWRAAVSPGTIGPWAPAASEGRDLAWWVGENDPLSPDLRQTVDAVQAAHPATWRSNPVLSPVDWRTRGRIHRVLGDSLESWQYGVERLAQVDPLRGVRRAHLAALYTLTGHLHRYRSENRLSIGEYRDVCQILLQPPLREAAMAVADTEVGFWDHLAAVAPDPARAHVLAMLALAHHRNGDNDRARACAAAALALEPSSSLATRMAAPDNELREHLEQVYQQGDTALSALNAPTLQGLASVPSPAAVLRAGDFPIDTAAACRVTAHLMLARDLLVGRPEAELIELALTRIEHDSVDPHPFTVAQTCILTGWPVVTQALLSARGPQHLPFWERHATHVPGRYRAHALVLLAVHACRAGDLERARAALTRSWARHPYSEVCTTLLTAAEEGYLPVMADALATAGHTRPMGWD